jgi:hypothetical protein
MENIIILEKIENIKYELNYYCYDEINFLLNLRQNTKKLVIFFHGLVYPNENIFAAKTKWESHCIDNDEISILSINDKVLEENRHMISTAFHETEQTKCHEKYLEIIKKIADITIPDKIILMGVSIGAFPTLYFGSLLSHNAKYKIIVVCFNSYLYIDDLYKKSTKKLKNDDKIIKLDIERAFSNSKIEDIYFYINRNDDVFFRNTTKFILFCKKNTKHKPNYIVFNSLSRYNNGHSTFLPDDNTFESIINNI